LDIEQAREVAVQAAEAAGALIRAGAGKELVVSAKGGGSDVITNLEPTAERCIVDHIRRHFPTHWIATEESGVLEYADETHVWVVDPLDGSNNVAIGLPVVLVGIALCQRGLPVVGVVHDPIGGETWSAVRDRGTVIQPVSRGVSRCGPVVAWTQGHGVARNDPAARSLRLVLESRSRRVLQLWAPLACWVMLARGAIDGFVGYCPEPWEMPAGTLLAREAGVAIRGLDGAPFDERLAAGPQSFVAARAEMLDDLLDSARRALTIQQRLATLLRGR
jgi:myo-inositol-1(or 4)-monophosphatase